MSRLLMITGLGSAIDLASGKRGAFYYTLEEFHEYWDRIDIISPKFRGSTSKTFEVEPLFENVYIHISPHLLFFHPIWFIKKALALHREQKFDLMTVQEFPPFYNGIGAWIISILRKIPYVLEIHHIPGYPKSGNLKERIYKKMMTTFIRFDASKAIAVRVVNQRQAPDFLKKAGVPAEKIVYIPSLYIDLDIFKPLNLKKEYDLIFVGRLEKNKGLDLLLGAAEEFKKQSPNFKMLIVGSGPLASGLKFKIENLKLQNNVLQYGWAKDHAEIAELINKSRVLAMLSYNEGGPRVVLEAMACGVPVVATPVGIVPDVIKNGESGFVVDWSADDIVEKILELLHNQAIYDKMSFAGLAIAQNFEKRAAIKNYAESLKKLANIN